MGFPLARMNQMQWTFEMQWFSATCAMRCDLSSASSAHDDFLSVFSFLRSFVNSADGLKSTDHLKRMLRLLQLWRTNDESFRWGVSLDDEIDSCSDDGLHFSIQAELFSLSELNDVTIAQNWANLAYAFQNFEKFSIGSSNFATTRSFFQPDFRTKWADQRTWRLGNRLRNSAISHWLLNSDSALANLQKQSWVTFAVEISFRISSQSF